MPMTSMVRQMENAERYRLAEKEAPKPVPVQNPNKSHGRIDLKISLDEIDMLFTTGTKWADIETLAGASVHVIRVRFAEQDRPYPKRETVITKERIRRAAQLYRAGHELAEIGRNLGVPAGSVDTILASAGVERTRSVRKKKGN